MVSKSCVVCDTMVTSKLLNSHMEEHTEQLKELRFSNDTKDAIKTACLICDKVCFVNGMRNHVKTHQITITEYKRDRLMGARFTLVEKVLHRCALCQAILLLDSDAIAVHLHKHQDITHGVYNAKHMVMGGSSRGTLVPRSSTSSTSSTSSRTSTSSRASNSSNKSSKPTLPNLPASSVSLGLWALSGNSPEEVMDVEEEEGVETVSHEKGWDEALETDDNEEELENEIKQLEAELETRKVKEQATLQIKQTTEKSPEKPQGCGDCKAGRVHECKEDERTDKGDEEEDMDHEDEDEDDVKTSPFKQQISTALNGVKETEKESELNDNSPPRDLPKGVTMKIKMNNEPIKDQTVEKTEQVIQKSNSIPASLTIKAKKDLTGQWVKMSGYPNTEINKTAIEKPDIQTKEAFNKVKPTPLKKKGVKTNVDLNTAHDEQAVELELALTVEQEAELVEEFRRETYPMAEERKRIASRLAVPEGRVRVWFQAARARVAEGGMVEAPAHLPPSSPAPPPPPAPASHPAPPPSPSQPPAPTPTSPPASPPAPVPAIGRPCSSCGDKFPTTAALLRHLQAHHYSLFVTELVRVFFPPSTTSSPSSSPTSCVQCSVYCPTPELRVAHLSSSHLPFSRLVRHGARWLEERGLVASHQHKNMWAKLSVASC